jgi:hypothetical protein
MSRLRVSEKTLELNVCAEVLQKIRSYPGCKKAFWIGMKQNQETKNGIDELIANVPSGMHLALQFKAPWSEYQTPYRFTINDKQKNNLLRLAHNRPKAVYYVFPFYNSFSKMRKDSPNLLKDTWLLPVSKLSGLHQSTKKSGTHAVFAEPLKTKIYSEPFPVDILSVGDVFEDIFGENGRNIEEALISQEDLKEWLYSFFEDNGESINRKNPQSIGQLLRGFSTFCIS